MIKILEEIEEAISENGFVRWVTNSEKPARLFLTALLVVVLMWGIAIKHADKPSAFEALSLLFSGLAFAGVVCTLLIQKSELSLQRKELEDTRHVLDKTQSSTQRFADATERNAKIEEFRQRIEALNLLRQRNQLEMEALLNQKVAVINQKRQDLLPFLEGKITICGVRANFYENSIDHFLNEFEMEFIPGADDLIASLKKATNSASF